MLVAIFILLLIVFFPLLSLLLGVGFMVVLVKFWWIFLILFGCLIFCRYIDKKEASEKEESKLRKQQEAIIGAIRGSQGGQSNNYTKLSFKGVPELSNDSYVLFITKKYAIEKNEVLGKYVLKEKLYNSIDEALQVGNELEQAEQEQRRESLEQSAIKAKADEAAYREMLTARKSNIKKLLVFLGLMLVIVVIGRVGYLKFHSDEPRSKDSWSSKNEHEMSNKELCDHFLGEEAANPDREKFLEESVKKYCPLGTLPYWKQPNYGK